MPQFRFLPSIIDRLLDPNSMSGSAASGTNSVSVIEAVRRDVEELLNSRRIVDPEVDRYPELSRSLFTFGVPELVSRPAISLADRESIGRLIADTINLHEPRLARVKVRLLGDAGTIERSVRFLITAVLKMEPSPGVEFETVVQMATGQTAVASRNP